MKSTRVSRNASTVWSLPVRGAWVEIANAVFGQAQLACRSPCGERGLKFCMTQFNRESEKVAPRAGSVG